MSEPTPVYPAFVFICPNCKKKSFGECVHSELSDEDWAIAQEVEPDVPRDGWAGCPSMADCQHCGAVITIRDDGDGQLLCDQPL